MITGGRWLDELPLTEVRTILEFIATGPAGWPKSMVRVLSFYLRGGKALPHELISVAERALVEVDSLDDDLDWNCSQVAIGIGRSDLDKAFGLFKRQIAAMKSGDLGSTWIPFHPYRSDEFWKFLRGKNPERAYRQLLALRGSEDKSEIGLVLDLEKHTDVLVKIAAEGEDNAAFFSGLVSGAQQGFSPFACSLMQLFPASEAIRSSLSSVAIYQVGSGEFNFGSASDKFQQAIAAIESELSTPSTPSQFIGWLEELKDRIQSARSSRRFRGNDEDSLDWD